MLARLSSKEAATCNIPLPRREDAAYVSERYDVVLMYRGSLLHDT